MNRSSSTTIISITLASIGLAHDAHGEPFFLQGFDAGNGLEGVVGEGFSTSGGDFFKSQSNTSPVPVPSLFIEILPELEFDSYFTIDSVGPSAIIGSVTEQFYGYGNDHQTNLVDNVPILALPPGVNITGGVAQMGAGVASPFIFSGIAPDGGDGLFIFRATVPVGETVVGGGSFRVIVDGNSVARDVSLDGTVAVFGNQALGLKSYLVADSSQNGGLGDTYDVWFQSGIDCEGFGQAPVILDEPSGRSVLPGVDVEFTVAADSAQPLTYQWIADGMPLTNNSKYGGVKTATLTIRNVGLDDVNGYRVVVSNACASRSSQDALLVVDPLFCQGDANKDGFIDFGDLTTVLGEWLKPCPGQP